MAPLFCMVSNYIFSVRLPLSLQAVSMRIITFLQYFDFYLLER
jgi:hypothetical protein